jgi:Ca2+-binding EF-hand superfamily protein
VEHYDRPGFRGFFDELVNQFVAVSSERVTQLGWRALFEQYDTDGSGELDRGEFVAAVRKDCKLPAEVVSDEELEELFCMIDTDGSSGISAEEFGALLQVKDDSPDMTCASSRESGCGDCGTSNHW